ncbi:Ectonucleotide pyrophosphatase/phosphodiesterase family member 5 [Orchesella cincta]|uniref:Ectonucleotide pyrophosphatase/phosphodiesterase family member 5 n=1 Tax=Orchesella cincta TaxID=48709 RepID=A0A1D2NDZ1_ORCCI|nr:Ectonucleotide pyrophosphatase/phosphodiesterase family member 5 [Orchesella cincta]
MYRFRSSPRCRLSSSGFLRLHLKTVVPLFFTTVVLLVLSENVDDSRTKQGTSRASRLSHHPVVIVISFDGFRYNYFQRTETPNMDILRDTGAHVQYMRNQFVTKTFPNHMSIATGLHAESHGVVDNMLYDPKYERALDWHNPEFWNFDNVSLPLWTLNEMAGSGRRSGVMMWPGSAIPFGVNETVPSQSLQWNESYPFETRIDIAIDWITDPSEPINMVFVYFEEPDEIAHAFGPESPNVTEYIQIVDNTTGYLINKLKFFGIYDHVNVILLSDHGFQEVKPQNMINYTSALTPKTYQAFGGTPVMHILPNDGKFDDVYSQLRNFSHNRNFTVYKKEELEPTWYYSNNRRIMPIVIVADLGFIFDDFQNNIDYYSKKFNFTPSHDRVYGVHGYDNRQLPMHPFFIAHGPAFRTRYQGDVFDNVDLYPLICKIVGLKPAPNNGTLKNVSQLLKRKGFAMGSPVGWAMGAAVIIGITVILGIMSALVSRRHNRRREIISDISNIREFAEIGGSNGKSSKSFPVNTEECQALLMSSSTEEL